MLEENVSTNIDNFIKAIEALRISIEGDDRDEAYNNAIDHAIDEIEELCPMQADEAWIPFKIRKPTREELRSYPDWCYVIDSEVPEDGQDILVTVVTKGHQSVQWDVWCDDGGIYSLDSGYDIGDDVIAWMPVPEAYKAQKGDFYEMHNSKSVGSCK